MASLPAGGSPGNLPIPFVYSIAAVVIHGGMLVREEAGDVCVDFSVAGTLIGTMTLTTDDATDASLRLIGAVVGIRRGGQP